MHEEVGQQGTDLQPGDRDRLAAVRPHRQRPQHPKTHESHDNHTPPRFTGVYRLSGGSRKAIGNKP
ncbi:hypothetical protein GCM10010156_28460 [Planobispora rosea]|uniref:Uncharacterized protein n=1 Tax=Planobispora rosea TaxID=35762 RepID=A0A8J3WAL4_PLARO|nr:hypothetical protein GCM10010156_28460 [Planobispora rosea]GIH81932.1 hypothetical protein Pro02_03400 [Planobispora rosea]